MKRVLGNTWKKCLGVFLSVAMLVGMLPLMSGKVFAADVSDEGGYDISGGSITVESDKDSGIKVNNLAVDDGKAIVIKGSSEANTVTIDAGADTEVIVVFRGVNIDVSASSKPAVRIIGEGNVIIKLEEKSTVKSGEKCAGIQKDGSGLLTITSDSTENSLTATGGFWGAGIGGGDEGVGSNITISGGTVTANGGEAGAGIGGGIDGEGTGIAISGGTVTANGGSMGAGIGGGSFAKGSNITISGGTVTATGGDLGAGIGGGMLGEGSNITISEGTVTATGGEEGAGIGGGAEGEGSSGITISGGTVTATGGEYGAGIGGGAWGDALDIQVQEGAVVSVAGGITDGYYGAGAGIGNGGSDDNNSNPVDGDELSLEKVIKSEAGTPFTGDIRYYEPGSTAEQIKDGTAKRVNYVTVTLNPNGGTGTEESIPVTRGLPTLLPDNLFTIPGHTFVKWTTGQDGTGTSYEADKPATFSADTTLYAQWSDHVFDQEVTTADYLETAADCTHAAVYYKSCVCGEKGTETFESGEPLGHDYKTMEGSAVAPTCEKAGKEADQKCENCGDVISGKEIAATGHTFDKEVVDAKYQKSAATCTEAAVYYKSCACGEKGTETFTSGNPLGHNYTTVDDSALAPTCEKAGKEADQKCENCGNIITGKEIAATGHAFDKEVVDAKYQKSAATCTEAAVYYKSCSICGEKGTETFTSGDPLGHTWKAATGYAPKTCEVCGATEGDVITYNSETGKTIEHTKDDKKDEVITYHRSEDDKNTINHYKGVQIDGKDVNVDAKSGSVIITFDAATLNALSIGDHVITVIFDDWIDELKLVIKAPAAPAVDTSPTTGDTSMPVLWITLLILSMAGASVLVMRRRKRA